MVTFHMISLVICLAAFSALSTTPAPLSKPDTQSVRVIFSTGNEEVSDPGQHGLSQLATYLNQSRTDDIPTFFIYGGSLGPNALSFYDRGAHVIDLANSLEPDVMVLTKRNFTLNRDQLAMRSREAMFPMVASNIKDKQRNTNFEGLLDSVIIEQGDFKLGVISLLDPKVIWQNKLENAKLLDISVISVLAKSLRAQGAKLVVLHYEGRNEALNSYLENGTIDLLLGKGLSVMKNTDRQLKPLSNHVLLLQRDFADIALSWKKEQPGSLTVQWQGYKYNDFAAEAGLQTQISGYAKFIDQMLAQPIGKSSVALSSERVLVRTEESAIGNFVADTIKAFANADIGLINAGAIKGTLSLVPQQSITGQDIVRLMPYRNKVVLLEVTGVQLLEALEHGFSGIEGAKGQFFQVSGLKIIYNSRKVAGNRIKSVAINGKPLKFLKKYKLATTSYIAGGGDGYSVFTQLMPLDYGQQQNLAISSVVINQIRSKGVIAPKLEVRIKDSAL